MPKTAALSAAVFELFTKNPWGGVQTPPLAGRGLKELSNALFRGAVALLVSEFYADL